MWFWWMESNANPLSRGLYARHFESGKGPGNEIEFTRVPRVAVVNFLARVMVEHEMMLQVAKTRANRAVARGKKAFSHLIPRSHDNLSTVLVGVTV